MTAARTGVRLLAVATWLTACGPDRSGPGTDDSPQAPVSALNSAATDASPARAAHTGGRPAPWWSDLPAPGAPPPEPPVYAVLDDRVLLREAPSPGAMAVLGIHSPDAWDPSFGGPGTCEEYGLLARVLARAGRDLLVETLPEPVPGLKCHPYPRFSPYSLRGYVAAARARPLSGRVKHPGQYGFIRASGGGSCGWSRGDPSYRIPAGTPISWPDGKRAGEAVFEHLYECRRPERHDDRLCFRNRRFNPEDLDREREGRLCAPESAVELIAAEDLRRRRASRFQLLEMTARGGLSRDVVRRITVRHLNEVRFCYDRERALERAARGTMTVSFEIAPVGSVGEVQISNSTTENASLDDCVRGAPARWRFPAAKKNTAVRLELKFGASATRDVTVR